MLGSRRTKDFQAISGCMLLQNCGAHGAALQENDVTHARAVGGTKTLHRVDIAKDRSAFLFFD